MAPITLDSAVLDDLLRRLDSLERQVAALTQVEVSTVGAATANTFTANQAIRKASASLSVGVDASNYFEILASSAGLVTMRLLTQSGISLIDFAPQPLDGSSNAQFRFFRSTNTSGQVSLDILKGNNTTTANARIGGNGVDSYLCADNGDLGVGFTTNPAQKLDVNGNARFRGYIQITDGVSAPSAVSGVAALYVDSADGDLKVKFGDGTTKTISTDT